MSTLFLDLPRVPLPGPRAWPFIGSRANLLRFFADPVTTMLRLRRAYGDVAAISRDDPGWVLAFGPGYNRQILSEPELFNTYAENPLPAPIGSAAHLLGINLIAQNGEVHRRNRRLMQPSFAKSQLPGYGEVMVEAASRVLADWPQAGVLDLRQQMIELSLQIGMSCLFGVELGSEQARVFGELTLRYLGLVLSPAAMLFPVALPGTPYRRYLEVCEQLVQQLRQLIARRREHGPGADVLSAMIGACDDDDGLGEDELIGQSGLLLVASHETTAMALSWSLLLLAAHPAIQQAVADEVDAALGGAPPTLADLERMPLLGHVVDETMRLLPGTPILFFRRSTRAFELGGRQLPVGSTVLLSPLLTHREPDLYPAPARFDPERWRTLRPGPYAYLPFGAGARRCLGAGFAAQAIRLILALALQRARFSVPAGTRVDYKVSGVVMGPRRSLRLQLSPAGSRVPAPEPIGGNLRQLIEFA